MNGKRLWALAILFLMLCFAAPAEAEPNGLGGGPDECTGSIVPDMFCRAWLFVHGVVDEVGHTEYLQEYCAHYVPECPFGWEPPGEDEPTEDSSGQNRPPPEEPPGDDP